MDIFSYLFNNGTQIWFLLIEHVRLTAIAVGMAILVGVPLGILVSYVRPLNKPILGLTNLIQAIPSMALLGFAIPLLGIGALPAVVVVFLYSLLPIVKNTCTGIGQISPQILEAAVGIGMTKFQILYKIQLPLTLPFLMAGVRIASVTAVGLMTMAAFIGAGGLGFLVFSGIASLNNGMILAGAIPACLLALAVDGGLSLVETLVTPLSLQPNALRDPAGQRRRNRIKKGIVCVLSAVLLFSMGTSAYHSWSRSANVIRIGSKQFSEQHILGNILKELIEDNTNLTVESHFGAGGTQVLFEAMQKQDLDLYIDYTGTVFVDILKQPPSSDEKTVYEISKKEMADRYNIQLLQPLRFHNDYALAVSPEVSEKYQLKTLSDLARVGSQLTAGFTLEFLNREDGLKGLEKAYDFSFAHVSGIDGANRYIALQSGNTQIMDAFTTDGLLKKFHLQLLQDDKKFFPPYYGVPLIRADVLKRHPELAALINQLDEKLDTTTMQELNYQVDEEHRPPSVVAHEFLVQQGLIHK